MRRRKSRHCLDQTVKFRIPVSNFETFFLNFIETCFDLDDHRHSSDLKWEMCQFKCEFAGQLMMGGQLIAFEC